MESSNIQKAYNECIVSLLYILVHPTGEMSNSLIEDYEAVLKFIDAETQKKKVRL